MNYNYERNVLLYFTKATKDEKLTGFNWYNDALNEVMKIADLCNIHPNIVGGVMAALSPSNKWERNVKDTMNLCYAYSTGKPRDAYRYCTYPAHVDKAIQILDESVSPSDALYGTGRYLKTLNFYRNIMGIDDKTAVTIDRHTINIARGTNVTHKSHITKKEYQEVSNAYVLTAKAIGLYPKQLQAVTWTTYKRLTKR